jgi:tetratricopeptide (TPR) repeat protein
MRILLVIAVLAFAAAPAGADPLKPEAQKRLDAGLALFQKGEYAKAIVEFKAAYDLDPAPKILFARAQAERLGGDCDTAIDLYEKYLTMSPTENQTAAAREAMKLCDGKTHPKQTTQTPPAHDDVTAPPPAEIHTEPPPSVAPEIPPPAISPSSTQVEPPRPWYRRHPIGAALSAVGAISIGVGAGYLISANAAKHRAEDEMNRDDFIAALDRANTRRKTGLGFVVIGGALVTAGLLEIALHHTGDRKDVVAGTDGSTIYVRAAF